MARPQKNNIDTTDNKGWISVHRKIQDHWLWQSKEPYDNFKAWLDILLTVNHSEQKVLIKGTLYTVKRGESIMSLDSWASRWKWNKSKVRRFLNLLQSDSMIELKNERKTTRLTVCNYDSYQDGRNANETQMKHGRNANETQMTPNNNDNNDNNENNDNNIESRKLKFSQSLTPFIDDYGKDMITDFYYYWTEDNKSGTKFRKELQKTWSLEHRLRTWKKNSNKFGPEKKESKPIQKELGKAYKSNIAL